MKPSAWQKLAVFVVVGVCILPYSRAAAEERRSWSRGIFPDGIRATEQGNGFSLEHISETDGHLVGRCYYAVDLKNGRDRHATLQGTKSNGVFWLDVQEEVRDPRSGQWRPIASPVNPGKRATVVVEANTGTFDLNVDLNAFKVFLDECEVGRLVLPSGETCEFLLKYLKPPD